MEIKNFRSIKSATCTLSQLNAIVGENNAGKTTVLKALNAFFNFEMEKESFKNRTHQFAPRNNTHITLTFDSIKNEDDDYSQYFSNDLLILKMEYKYGVNKLQYSSIVDKNIRTITESDFKNLLKDIEYVYIPIERVNKDNNSIFTQLLLNYITKYTSNRDTISSHVRTATNTLHKNILTKLEKNIKDLYLYESEYEFNIDVSPDIDYKILLDSLNISLKSNDGDFYLEEYGSGTRSLATIAMFRANAHLKGKSIVLGLEEPETNLHPQAQKKLVNSLKSSMSSMETQTIFTTHSTVLIDQLKHEDIILARKEKYNEFRNASELTQLGNNFWENGDIEEFKHYQYFHYKNSDFFYSRYVVVCESKNDCQVIKKLLQDELGYKISEVSFLNADGKNSMKYAYYLLKALNIPFTLIVDRDFFYRYVNNSLAESRNNQGLPIYNFTELNKLALLDAIFEDKNRLLNIKNYRPFFEEISKYNILSMMYCLEMDLTCSTAVREEFYKILDIKESERNQKELLEKNAKSIKKIENIIQVIENVPLTKLPESFLKIKKFLKADIIKYL